MTVIPILLQAEPSERALHWGIRNLADVVYRMEMDGTLVGAATLQWRNDPCEIMELAIVPEHQRHGLGRMFLKWIINEARRKGKRELIVGTASNSLSNIAFYQKCGLRVHAIRKDYFSYYDEPHYENGILVRDMLVFHYDLTQPD